MTPSGTGFFNKRGRLWAVIGALVTILAAGTIWVNNSYSARDGFITRDGTRLMLNGEQYKFAGINWDAALGCWDNEVPTQAEAERFFGALNPRSVTRIWVMPGSDLTVYDRLFNAARKYNQFLDVTLFNGQTDCTNLRPSYASALPASEASWIDAVVGRHANEPTSAMFEIANEADESNSNIAGWYNAVAARIKMDNPRALVGTGGGNNANLVDQIKQFAGGPDIDLISLHDYYPDGVLSPRAGIFAQAARELGKPWYMGERGFCCGGGDSGSYADNGTRLTAEYTAYLADATNAGYLYWDFKLRHDETTTANFGNQLWDAVTGYQNGFLGGY